MGVKLIATGRGRESAFHLARFFALLSAIFIIFGSRHMQALAAKSKKIGGKRIKTDSSQKRIFELGYKIWTRDDELKTGLRKKGFDNFFDE